MEFIMNKIIDNVKEKEIEIKKILLECETEDVANEEIKLSLTALKKSTNKYRLKAKACASFLPMNLPLYSLVTYAIIPRLTCKQVNYRSSRIMMKISRKLHNLLNLEKYAINLYELEKKTFIYSVVNYSDVVIFVGKYENAVSIQKNLKENIMFLYFGTGYNPIVINRNANLKLTIDKVNSAILFNSGQDCAKPNIIFVHKDILNNILDGIKSNITNKLCNIIRGNDFHDLIEFAYNNKMHIHNEIKMEFHAEGNQAISPIIVVRNFCDFNFYNMEIYGPIYNIIVFENNDNLQQYFKSRAYLDHAMYISIFGSNRNLEDNLYYVPFLHNSIVSDVDVGYKEYGGYGKLTSFIVYRGLRISKPLLVNREIDEYLNNSLFTSNINDNLYDRRVNKRVFLLNVIKNKVIDIFSDNLYFVFCFGSFIKDKHAEESCDLDIFICLKQNDFNKMKEFRKWYFKFHYMFGMIPDFIYPAEIISFGELKRILTNLKGMNLKMINNSNTYDSVFYTQIILDEKEILFGDKNYIELEKLYLKSLKHQSQKWCNQIIKILKKENSVVFYEQEMKLKFFLYNEDLYKLCEYIHFDEIFDNDYYKYICELDNGNLRLLYRQQVNSIVKSNRGIVCST